MPDARSAANGSDCRKDEAGMNKKINILYERLSKDDELQGPSNSILNQQKLLEDFAEKNGLVPYRHIQDDGWSGTAWHRPGWQEVLALVEADEVACICIKDLSRMSRDYLRAGLDRQTFLDKGVRLIAVNDGYDSERGEDDFTPFKEIMAEWYARDTSRKIRSVYQSKGKSGKHTSSHALYGYKKSDSDKNQWVVDEPAAEIVRRVFAMTIEGKGPYQIAETLSAERVECPSYYLSRTDCGNYKNKEFDDPYRWWGTTVTYLLQRVEYMGHTVNFKTTQKSFKNKRRYPNERDNWMVFENTHEPIVSAETWELANKLRNGVKRYKNSMGEANPLTGLLFCADCGAKLYNERTNTNPDKPKDVYICASYRKKTTDCTTHRVDTKAIEELVLETLRAVTSYASANEDAFRQKVADLYAAKVDGEVKAQRKQLAAYEKRRGELDKLIQKVFEEHTLGNLSGKRFKVLSEGYEQEQEETEAEIAMLRTVVDRVDDSEERAEGFLSLVRRYRDFPELTGQMLNEFVEKIVVHERADKSCQYTEQKIEIHLNFIGAVLPNEVFDINEHRMKKMGDAQAIKRREYHREYQRRRKENGGKPLTPEDARTPEQIAADEEAKREYWKAYQRDYQREWQRKKAAEKRASKEAEVTATASVAEPKPAA